MPRPHSLKQVPAAHDVLRLCLVLILGALVVPPLIVVIVTSFNEGRLLSFTELSFTNYINLVRDDLSSRSIWDTMIFAAGTAPCAVGLGALAAWLTERTDAPFRQVIYVAAVAGLVVPTIIQAIGWVLVLGPNQGWVNVALRAVFGEDTPTFPLYSMPGLIFVQSIMLFPVAFLLMVPTFRATDPYLEEAAQVSGAGRLKIVTSITAPLARPSSLAAGLLCIILTVEGFEVPALIGTPSGIFVLSTEILGRIRRVVPDYGGASAFAMVGIVLTLLALLLYYRATRSAHRYAILTGKAYNPHRIRLGGYRLLAGTVAVVVAATVALPIVTLLWASLLPTYSTPSWEALRNLSISNYVAVIEYRPIIEATRNTLLFATIAAPVVVAIAFLTSWITLRSKGVLGKVLDQLGTLPLVVPGIILSLAILRVYVHTPLWGSAIVLVVAYVLAYLPYGMRLSYSGLLSLHRDLEDAALVAGGGIGSTLRRIVIPIMIPTLLTTGLFVFIGVIRQLSTVIFLTGTRHQVVSTQMLTMWDMGMLPVVAAFAVLVVVGVSLIALIIWMFGSRRGIRLDTSS